MRSPEGAGTEGDSGASHKIVAMLPAAKTAQVQPCRRAAELPRRGGRTPGPAGSRAGRARRGRWSSTASARSSSLSTPATRAPWRVRLAPRDSIDAVFPTTTASALATLTTGRVPGSTAWSATRVLDPAHDRVVNQLSGWDDGLDPATWQRRPTVFETAAEAGIASRRDRAQPLPRLRIHPRRAPRRRVPWRGRPRADGSTSPLAALRDPRPEHRLPLHSRTRRGGSRARVAVRQSGSPRWSRSTPRSPG